MPEAISLYKENQAVEEKQSYAMVTGLLQVLVHMQLLKSKDSSLISSFDIEVASIAYQRYVMYALGFCSP